MTNHGDIPRGRSGDPLPFPGGPTHHETAPTVADWDGRRGFFVRTNSGASIFSNSLSSSPSFKFRGPMVDPFNTPREKATTVQTKVVDDGPALSLAA